MELNAALGDVPPTPSPTSTSTWGSSRAGDSASSTRAKAFPKKRYLDVGAVVSFLRAVPWHYEGFDARTHRAGLRAIHETIQKRGAFAVRMHRFLLEAIKPERG